MQISWGWVLAAVCLSACRGAAVVGPVIEEGVASFYSDALAGRPTASGEPYDPRASTCAHKRLAFGTVVQIERIDTGQMTRCRINDRGPFVEGRIIDLSRSVAETLGIEGLARVRLRVVED